MKKIFALSIAVVLSTSAIAATGFLKNEMSTGMTKQCVYDVLGSTVIITVNSYELCPLTINR